MTREDLEVLRGFDAVWERVLTGNAATPAPKGREWERLLQGLYAHWQGCLTMSRQASGETRRRLTVLAAETRELFRTLQTEYFLETGDIFLTIESANFASCTPCNLRKLWKNAVELARELQNAGEAEIAAAMERQGETLKRLIRSSLK